MLHFNSLIDIVLPDLGAINKKQIFKNIAQALSRKTEIDQNALLKNLLTQDKNEGLGIAQGVAIFHLRISSLKSPVVSFVRLKNMVEFNAADNQPVDLICIILTPESEINKQLQKLAEISRLLSDPDLCEKIREAEDADALYQLFSDLYQFRKAA